VCVDIGFTEELLSDYSGGKLFSLLGRGARCELSQKASPPGWEVVLRAFVMAVACSGCSLDIVFVNENGEGIPFIQKRNLTIYNAKSN